VLFTQVEFWVLLNSLVIALLFVRSRERRKWLYLIASYVFYMWWNPAFIFLIIFSTVLDFFVAPRIARSQYSRWWLALSVSSNLGVLGVFKYFGFFEDNLFLLMRSIGYEPNWVSLNIILPVGISFYTFQTMSYSIDVYRKKIEPTKSLLDFSVFVAFFPQLVAGPIIRAADFLPQLSASKEVRVSKEAVIVDRVFSDPGVYPSSVVILAAVCFSIQIYCDFSGYTDIAIGVARILGFDFPKNFNKPYFAATPSEFWRRWHISLSSWLRDYLYIPLGGSKGSQIATYRNLLFTMLLGGLWHGASWNFLLWGLLHGLVLVLYRFVGITDEPKRLLSRILGWLIFQWFVVLTWIVFRIEDFSKMTDALAAYLFIDFSWMASEIGLGTARPFSTIVLVITFWGLHTFSYFVGGFEKLGAKFSWPFLLIVTYIIFLIGFFFLPTEDAPFIYFQF